MSSRLTILAIETAIGGGSISLLRGGDLVNSRGSISRAEDVLLGIDQLLAESHVTPNEIDLVAVSLGPGSFTGIRIGVATALGLKASLGARCVGVNALEALSRACPNEDVVVVLSLGRGYYALQEFSPDGGEPKVVDENELIRFLSVQSDIKVIFYEKPTTLATQWKRTKNLSASTEPLSTLIGECALAGGGSEDLRPLYLRNHPISKV